MVVQQKQKKLPRYQRLRYTVALKDVVAKIAKPLFKQRQTNLIDLIAHWNDIVGPDIAHLTAPLKLSEQPQRFYETQAHQILTLRFQPGFGLDLMHQQSLILERINQYLGGEVVHSLRLVEGVVISPKPMKKRKTNNIRKVDHAYKEKLNDLDDENLRQVLTRLGNILYTQ